MEHEDSPHDVPRPDDAAASRDGSMDPVSPTRHRGRDRWAGRPVEEQAQALKERVYATFTGLAIVLVQAGNAEHLAASQATLALLVGIVGITAAGFVADVVAHLAVHAAFPNRGQLVTMLRVAGEALASASVPLILLVLAWVGVFDLQAVLRASSFLYIVTLGLIGYVAVRRTRVEWWKQLIALGILMGLGVAVIGLQQLAHAQ